MSKQTVKFGDICHEVKLTSKDPLADGYDKYIGLEHLDSGSLKIKRWGDMAEDSPSFTRVFKKGQILFGKRRPYLKKAAIAEFDGVCSGDIVVMEPKGDLILPKLLPFIVQSDRFWDWAVKTSSGSLSPRTKFKELALLSLTLPNKKTQASSLCIFEKSMRVESLSIETMVASDIAVDRAIDKILFEAGDDSYKGFFGQYRSDYVESALDDLTEESAFGPRYPSDKYSLTGNIGTIRTTDFDKSSNVNFGTVPFAELDEEKFSSHLLVDGDLLITRSGTCGLVSVYRDTGKKIIPGAFIIRFRLRESIDPDFIKLFLMRSRVQQYIYCLSSGGVQKNLTSKNLLKIKLALPPDDVIELLKNLHGKMKLIQTASFDKLNSLRAIRQDLLKNWY